MNINLEYYRVFYNVAVYKSITRAANEMFISQPAVSKSIRNLEEKLQCPLFCRSAHGTTLTREGEILFAHVSQAFQELSSGEEKICRNEEYEAQDLYIGATESALYTCVLPALLTFQKECPNVKFHISGCATSELIELLRNGEVDLAIGVMPIPGNLPLPVIQLSDIQDIFFVHRGFAGLSDRLLSPEEIVQYPIAALERGTSGRQHMDAWFREKQIDFSPVFTVRTSSLVLPFVEHQLAIGIAPKWAAKAGLASGMLTELRMTSVPPPRKLFLAVNEKYPNSSVCSKFIDLLKAGTKEL